MSGFVTTYKDGSVVWRNEVFHWHREDGPAFIGLTGVCFYLDDKQYTLPDFALKQFGDTEEATAFILRWLK